MEELTCQLVNQIEQKVPCIMKKTPHFLENAVEWWEETKLK